MPLAANSIDHSKKRILTKLWNETNFSIWANMAKREAASLHRSIQGLIHNYRGFQHHMDLHYDQICLKQHKLPIFHVINQELQTSKHRIDTLLQAQASSISKLIELLGSFRETLQYGEITAMNEYTEAVSEALNSRYTQRKILGIHKQYLHMNLQKKLRNIDRTHTRSFENWFANFSLRSQEFFREMYSTIEANKIKFCQPQNQNVIPHTQKVQAPKDQLSSRMEEEVNYPDNRMEEEEPSDDDIVKQIYREMQGAFV